MRYAEMVIWLKSPYKDGGSAEARRQPLSERSSEAEQLAYIQRWRGFESFRSDGFMTIIDFLLMAPVERRVLFSCNDNNRSYRPAIDPGRAHLGKPGERLLI